MKHFIINLIRFSLPLLIIFALPVAVLFLGREYVSVHAVVEKQARSPQTLFGFMYNGQSFVPYKEQLVDSKKPELVVLGTSRMMQVRENFFKEGVSFVNAGGGAKNIHDVKRFIENLPASVSVVILGLDQDMFTSSDTKPSYESGEDRTVVRLRKLLFTNMRKVYIDVLFGKYSLNELLEKRNNGSVGVVAIMRGDGFRGDGSYRYGHIITEETREERVSQEIAQTAQALGVGRYASFATSGNEDENMRVLQETLAIAKAKNIYIVGVLPPYPTLLYETMKSHEAYGDTITKLPQTLSDIFKQAEFPLFDFSHVRSYGGNDAEFVDNIHASDKASLRMLIRIAEKVKQVRGYVDIPHVRTMLDLEPSNMFTF